MFLNKLGILYKPFGPMGSAGSLTGIYLIVTCGNHFQDLVSQTLASFDAGESSVLPYHGYKATSIGTNPSHNCHITSPPISHYIAVNPPHIYITRSPSYVMSDTPSTPPSLDSDGPHSKKPSFEKLSSFSKQFDEDSKREYLSLDESGRRDLIATILGGTSRPEDFERTVTSLFTRQIRGDSQPITPAASTAAATSQPETVRPDDTFTGASGTAHQQ